METWRLTWIADGLIRAVATSGETHGNVAAGQESPRATPDKWDGSESHPYLVDDASGGRKGPK